ncbi:MAG: hypothetical protein IPJ24_01780 [bacterium]|nr:hypothetical protein [bacterium]
MRVVPIILTGEPSPGMPGGVVLQRLGAPLINAGGDVACSGIVQAGKEKVQCLWVGRPGALRLAATSEGKDIPFTPYSRHYLANDGYAVFESRRGNFAKVLGFGPDGLHHCPAGPLHGTTSMLVTLEGRAVIAESKEIGLVSWQAKSAPITIAHVGDLAPGMPGNGLVFGGFPERGLSAAGSYVVFWSYLKGPGIEQMGRGPSGIWLHGPTGLTW